MSKLDDLRIDAPPPRPRRRHYFPWFPVVLVVFCATVVLWLFRDSINLSATPKLDSPAPAVEETTPTAGAVPAGPPGSISAAGYLEVIPPGPFVAAATVSGRVDDLLVVPGDAVTAGQLIARLDTANLAQQAAVLSSRVELSRRRLAKLQAGVRSEEIDQARAVAAGARAALAHTEAELTRARTLYETGIIPGQELAARDTDLAKAQSYLAEQEARVSMLKAGTRQEDVSIAEAELNAARSELNSKQWEIGQCRITAPVDGVVLELFVQPGDWVTPGTDNPRSPAILSTFDPRSVQAWVDVNQRDSSGLFPGQQVELTTDAHPQRSVAGTVSHIMPSANLQKNTVQVKIAIVDPPVDFRPELSVKVTFLPLQDPETTANEEAGNE